ncbi:MAG: DUF2061 domain-containing protein [Candidatus Nanohaloarchaea archaeon]
MGLREKAGKSLSWRLHASASTLIVSYLLTGSMKVAGSLAAVLMIEKFFLFMYHEKLWEILDARGYVQ